MKKQLVYILVVFSLGLAVLIAGLRWVLIERTLTHHAFVVQPHQDVLILGDSHPACSLLEDSSWVHLGKSGEAWYYAVVKGRFIVAQNPHIKTVIIECNAGQLSSKMEDWIYDEEHMERAFKSYYPILPLSVQWDLFVHSPLSWMQKFFIAQKRLLTASIHADRTNDFKQMEWGGHEVNDRTCADSLKIKTWSGDSSTLVPFERNVQALESFIVFCQEREVEVKLMRCPVHHSSNPDDLEFVSQFVQKRFPNLVFMDFKNEITADSLYLDREHLNEKGAQIFTPFFRRKAQIEI
ncbi:MAG: hypothetical protein RL609_314 [Bacteroidota bacterium]|jgi:hypothetical protein